jgi:hypothetical protein
MQRIDHNPGSSRLWPCSRRDLFAPLLCCLAIQAGWFVLLVHLDKLMLPSTPNLVPDAPARPAMIWR